MALDHDQALRESLTDLPSGSQLERMYEAMAMMTVAEERISAEVKSGSLKATFYPVRGLEGVCAALGACLTADDYLVSTYRNLGDALAKGALLSSIVAELYGRVGGMSKGKGGPMHLHNVSTGFMATTGIVGSGLPIAVGLALSAQMEVNGRVTAVTFGDGATSIGAYHEAMNLASLWNLPIVFVCQNNQWAEHTPIAEYAANTDLAGRADSYAMSADSVDGFDPIATWGVLHDAVEAARRGEGPRFVECRTYRLTGHTSATEYSYMPEGELHAATAKDPTPAFRERLQAEGLVDASTLSDIDRRVAGAVKEAFTLAVECPPPSADEIYVDVFASEGTIKR
jgi:TPP-dependent pyruvate/acetoin dehydrogenase alpha subunit